MSRKDCKKSGAKEIAQEFIGERKRGINLLAVMVVRNVRTMYRESVLGIIWTVLNPLLTMFVLSFVYSQIFGRDMVDIKYPVYVLSGMIVYNTMFRAGTTQGLTSIVGKRSLVLQTRINISMYPRVAVYTAFVNFLFSFIALIIVMLVTKQAFHWTLLMTVVLLPPLVMVTMGVAFILSVVYIYFRDINNIYNVFATLLMYATPIFYTVTQLKNPLFTKVAQFNPMYYFVTYFREIIMGHVPSLQLHLILYGLGIVLYAFGLLFITQSRKKFIFHL